MGKQATTISSWLEKARAGGPDTCATFEADGDADKWVQFVGATLNCAWPSAHPPGDNAKLKPLLLDVSGEITDWAAQRSAMFEVPSASLDAIATFVDRYFVAILGCADGRYELEADLMQM